MPDVLAHYGAQWLPTRAVLGQVAPRWFLLGCILPDLPWILLRAIRAAALPLDPYDLRLYIVIQASLAGCLLLGGAIALCSARPRGVFAALALGSLLHLLLDACQTKWANGVHLLAPFSWKLVNFGLFWPENVVSYLLTALGAGVTVWLWRRRGLGEPRLDFGSPPRLLGAGLLGLAYLLGPLPGLAGPEAVDNHSVKTLRERDSRPGRSVAFDRAELVVRDGGPVLKSHVDREELRVVAEIPLPPGIVSARATFIDRRTIRIHELHRHAGRLRDVGSYLGLAALALFWLAPRPRGARLAPEASERCTESAVR